MITVRRVAVIGFVASCALTGIVAYAVLVGISPPERLVQAALCVLMFKLVYDLRTTVA